MKKIITIICLFIFSISTINASSLDLNSKGSIDITLKYNELESVEGANINIYKIADMIIENNNIAYQYVSELSGEKFELKDLTGIIMNETEESTNQKILELAKKINVENLTPISGTTDSEGNVKFNDLTLGLYLIKQEGAVKGYTSIEPYLLTIPTIINDEYIYDIDSLPKVEIDRLIDLTINKVWNNNTDNKLPELVTIEIYKDNELFETVELNEENNWTITLEQIPYSDSYSVKEINIPKGYKATYTNNEFTYTIINTNKLPQTGNFTYIIPILFALGLAFISLGLYEEKKKNIN